MKEELEHCQNDNDKYLQQISDLKKDTTNMGRSLRNYQEMLSVNMGEQDKLNTLLSQKMNELDERERTINELQTMINQQSEKVKNIV